MRLYLRQIRALAWLLVRYWRRGALPIARARSKGRRASGFLFRILGILVFGGIGAFYGRVAGAVDESERGFAVAWLCFGLCSMCAFFDAASAGPGLRGVVSPLLGPMLESLPLGEASRVTMLVLQNALGHALAIGAVYGASASFGAARAVGIGLALSATSSLAGLAGVRALRTLVSPMRLVRIWQLLTAVTSIPAWLTLASAAPLAHVVAARPLVAPFAPIAGAILGTRSILSCSLPIAITLLFSAAVLNVAERVGYDRIDAVPTRRPKKVPPNDLTLERVERVLHGREPARWGTRVTSIYSLIVVALGIFVLVRLANKSSDETLGVFLKAVIALSSTMAFFAAGTRAYRLVERDVAARPFLAPLPIAPSDLLLGKTRALKRQVMIAAGPLVLLLLMPGSMGLRVEVAWRVSTTLVALWFATDAVVSIAFLTYGLGSARDRLTSGFRIESLLLLAPFLGVAVAPYVWSAFVSLASVVLLAIEARRGALACARWLDDGEPFERETPVWRALVVFATFQALQTFVARLLVAFDLDDASRLAITYASAAAVLVALSVYERQGAAPFTFLAKRASSYPLGLAAGIASGFTALAYATALKRAGVESPPLAEGAGRFALAAVLVIVAPFAEEIFFRARLQGAIAAQYENRGRWFPIVIAAFAFACVHPPLSFPPVLLLGLFTGVLFSRTRSVVPTMIAHAAHNLIAVTLL